MSWLWSLASGVASRVVWVIGLWLFAPSVVFVLAAWVFLHDSDFSLWLLNCLPGEALRTQCFYRGKVVWVVGASSGIGRQLALQVSRTGGFVILSGRRAELLEKVREECERGYLVESIKRCNRSESKIASVIEEVETSKSRRVLVLPLDIGDPEKVEEAVETATTWKQRIDAVFVTAGTLERAERPPLRSELDLFSRNLYPQAHLFRSLLSTFESIVPIEQNDNAAPITRDLPSVEAFADLKRLTSQKHVSVTSFVRQASIAGIQKGCEVMDDSWAAKLWRKYGKGEPDYKRFVSFVILSSADARLGRPGTAALAASKKALQIYCSTIAREFYAQGLRGEHSTNLTVSTVLLGAAQTSAIKDCLLSDGTLCGHEDDDGGLYAESNALPSDRVAELVIRTARHRLTETWVAKGTTLFQLYCHYYLPWIHEFLSRRFFDRTHYNWVRAFNLGEIL